jgi:hypothetical protein
MRPSPPNKRANRRKARKGDAVAEPAFHLAQYNIARLRAPLDPAEMAEFVAFLDPVNAHAERCLGFVWRLTAPGGGPSSFLAGTLADPMAVPNLSVWTDLEALRCFVYQTVHRYFLQQRRQWFEPMDGRHLVLWWVPIGHAPSLPEAEARLRLLGAQGPTANAFTFQDAFDSQGRSMRSRAPSAAPA